MANYVIVEYDSSYPTGPSLQADDSDAYWNTHGLQVKVSLIGPTSGWTATQYKIWGIDGISTEGSASWEPLVPTVTGTISETNDIQYIYAKYKDEGSNESGVVTSSGIQFTWTDPEISDLTGVGWKASFQGAGYESADSAIIRNTTDNVEITLDKANIDQLFFHNRDFSGLVISGDNIGASETSQIAQLLDLQPSSYVSVSKVFPTDEIPFIAVDIGTGFKALTKYDGTLRSDVSGDYLDRITNYDFTSGTKTLTFDLYKFSTYGFTTIQKVEFTDDSSQGGYLGTSINLKVQVTDTNGEGVESAPVTFSGVGDDIGNFVSNPVNTDVDGYATATLALDTVGYTVMDAYVDNVHTVDDQPTWCLASGTRQRSLLTQYEQIDNSETFDDSIVDVNNAAVAEPTATSGTENRLENGLNVIRTLIKDVKGTTDWFGDLGQYFDPTSCSGGADTKDLTISNISGHTLDSKTILVAVDDYTQHPVSSGTSGVLISTLSRYATDEDRIGLPIFSSTGAYYDEGGSDEVCEVDVLNTSSGTGTYAGFEDESGNKIYAKLHDGADNGGSGSETDVYIRFYANGSVHTLENDDVTHVSFVYPKRRVLSDVEEYEIFRTDFINSFEADRPIVDDLVNLWSYTGASNDDATPAWSNTSANYIIDSSDDLQDATDSLNDEIGDRDFTENNYIIDGEDISEILDDLDVKLKEIADQAAGGALDIYVEEVSSTINKDTFHSLPGSLTYTPESTSSREGKNMDIFIDGQMLAADTGVNGANVDRDYSETSVSGITFHRKVHTYSNITYRIRQ